MRIGIDLGGTKIEAIAIDDDGAELVRRRIATPRDYDETIRALAEIVAQVEQATGETGTVGMGHPGTISPATGLIKNANSTWLIGRPLDKDLAEALGRDVRLTNDANCFALSEATDGAGAGAEVVFGVILGTGVGGGIVVRGHVLRGPNAIAGEWGHSPLPWPADDERPGPDCYCGLKGCIETFLCGPGFQRDLERATGRSMKAIEIERAAASGDAEAAAAVERYEHRLARALATVINLLDPDVIVLGGGMSNMDRIYETVPRLWLDYVFSDTVETKLAKNLHGDSSGVRGAAWLWDEK
jgi:fructokinase